MEEEELHKSEVMDHGAVPQPLLHLPDLSLKVTSTGCSLITNNHVYLFT